MGKTYLPDGQGAIFKNIIRFAGGTPLDGRAVVDSYSDIQGDRYKTLFTHEGVESYYEGMLVVTKDTGKVYVLLNGTFVEVTPDLSQVLGSKSVNTYAEAIQLATANNIGQIIYVKTKSSYDADGEEGEGVAIEYDAAPYIVIGAGSLMKLAASSASGDIESDVRELTTKVSTLETTVGDEESGLVKDVNELESIVDTFIETTVPTTYATKEELSGETNARETAISGITEALKGKVNVVEGSRLMTETEGTKLEGIAAGAQVNVIEVVKVNGSALTVSDSDKSVDITVPTAPVQGVKSKSDGQILTLDGDKLDTTLTIAYVPASKGDNGEHIPSQLRLQGVDNTVISSINADTFVKDGMIENVTLDGPKSELGETGKKYLVITWNTESGKDVMRLDVSELFNPYTAENGVQLSEGKFSIKLATDEQYLSVGTDGLATTEALWTKVTELDNAVLSAATAYADSLSVNYDASGSSAQALVDAKAYTDELAGNVYTKEDTDKTFVKTENFNEFSQELETKLENIEAGAEVNIIESVTVNGIDAIIDNKNASVKIEANDIELGTAIKNGEEDKYSAETKLSVVLQGIQDSIRGAIAGGVNSVSAGDTAIVVNSADANNPTVSLKVEESDATTIANGHIAIVKSNEGIYATMYYGGDDTE